MIFICLAVGIIFLAVIITDTFNKILTIKYLSLILIIVLSHFVIIYSCLNNIGNENIFNQISKNILGIEIGIFLIYFIIRISLFPIKKQKDIGLATRVMFGGRRLIYYGLLLGITEIIFFIFNKQIGLILSIKNEILNIDEIAVCIVILVILINGYIRIFWTSKRLRILRRIVVMTLVIIPVINIFVLLYLSHIAYIEYDHESNKVINNKARVETQTCKTKYPIVMLHGIGFKDFKYVNYWGRIPKELIKNGATIYYGNQEAFGTVKNNSDDIRDKIEQVIKETNSQKVNIIAHSKGGLDARYTISNKGLENKVASITTIGTPHRGCKMIDYVCKIPDRIYIFIGKIVDWYYKKIGDKNPEFCVAVKQFSTDYSKQFNEEIKDVKGVYYQSYTSVMRNAFSDSLLSIPYIIINKIEGENDGLVSVESSKWGEFKGIIKNVHRRGISHGDIIDLKREDYKGFDPAETYIKIVSELKNMGF